MHFVSGPYGRTEICSNLPLNEYEPRISKKYTQTKSHFNPNTLGVKLPCVKRVATLCQKSGEREATYSTYIQTSLVLHQLMPAGALLLRGYWLFPRTGIDQHNIRGKH